MKYENDGFDPTPYDRILGGIHTPAKPAGAEEVRFKYGNTFPSPVERREYAEEAADKEEKEKQVEEEREKEAEAPKSEIAGEMKKGNQQEKEEAEIRIAEQNEEDAQGVDPGEEETEEIILGEEGTDEEEIIEGKNEKISEAQLEAETEPEEKSEETEGKERETEREHEKEEQEKEREEKEEEAKEVKRVIEEVRTDNPKIRREKEKGKVTPLGAALISSDLKFTDIRDKEPTRIFLEEDILVPDIKPDMAFILSVDGHVKCGDKEIKAGQKGEDFLKVAGDINLKIIYIPEMPAMEHIVTMQSRIPFKTDWGVSVSPLSSLLIKPTIENIDYMIINERKFRVRITVALVLTEYAAMDLDFFEGVRDEEVQLLKGKIKVTDVLARKSDSLEISEEMALPSSAPVPERILRYDINVVENHKQITSEKAVINGSIYCNVLYFTKPPAEGGLDEASEETVMPVPMLFQGKTEFTQFIPLESTEGQAGSRITLDAGDLSVRIKNGEEGEGSETGFVLEGTIATALEVYRNIEKEIVTDVYHNEKDLVYENTEFAVKTLSGSGVTEVSAREIVNVPDNQGDVDRVIYISGKIKDSMSTAEQGKEIVSGNINIEILTMGSEGKGRPFKIERSIPFRGTMDIPGAKSGMHAESDIYIKELWFDKINNRQIEVNAGLFVTGMVFGQESYSLIKNPAFVEGEKEDGKRPGIILYISGPKDNLWKIAKKFRTTVESISRINGIEQNQPVSEGSKLLIIK